MKQKYIEKVLMCKPDFYRVDYKINPWMKPGTVNPQLAREQWEKLVEKLYSQKIDVNVIAQNPDLPDMVFAADQGITCDDTVVISNFRFSERKGESNYYQEWFRKNNYTLKYLPDDFYFEGSGDTLWLGNKLLVGTGFRNTPGVCTILAEKLNVEAICLELVNPYFYHLDTALFILNQDSAFYYPKAFSLDSIALLQDLIPNLHIIELKEAQNFAANSLVTDHHVIIQKGNSKTMAAISSLGYKTIELEMSEFNKAGGGIHCLVQTIQETYL